MAFDDFPVSDPFADFPQGSAVRPPGSAQPPAPAGVLPAGASAPGTPAGTNQTTPVGANDAGILQRLATWANAPQAYDLPLDVVGGTERLWRNIGQAARLYNQGLTSNLWDPTVGTVKRWFGAGSPAQERALTQQAAQTAGPVATAALETAGMATGPGKLMRAEELAAQTPGMLRRVATRVGGGTLEGGALGGVSALGRGEDTWGGTAYGGALGAGTGVLTGMLPGGYPALSSSSTTADLQAAANNAMNEAHSFKFDPKDLRAAATAANNQALREGMTETGNKAAYSLLNSGTDVNPSFLQHSLQPRGETSIKNLLDWQSKANSLTGDDARYGQILSDRIEDVMNSAKPAFPKKATSDDAFAALDNARRSQAVADQSAAFDTGQGVDNSGLGKAAAYVGQHAYPLGKGIMFGLGGALHAAGAGLHAAGQHELAYPLEVAGTTLFASPTIEMTANRIAARELAERTAMARASNAGTPLQATPGSQPYSQALRNLIFGGYAGY